MTGYVIRQTRTYYGPAETKSLVLRDDGQHALTFATLREAREWIDGANSERYYQANNEYGRPEYKILPANRLPAYLETYL